MVELVKKTAVVCAAPEEFDEFILLRHKPGVAEYAHVTDLASLEAMEYITNVIYLPSAKELVELSQITDSVNEKGVTQKWQ